MSSSPPRYKVGMTPVFYATFRDEAKVLTTPTTRTAKYEKPNGTEGTIIPTVASVGVLRVELPVLDLAGTWHWRVAGTAGVAAAHEATFRVDPTVF